MTNMAVFVGSLGVLAGAYTLGTIATEKQQPKTAIVVVTPTLTITPTLTPTLTPTPTVAPSPTSTPATKLQVKTYYTRPTVAPTN